MSRGHHGHIAPYLDTVWENSAIWELANKLGEIQIHVLKSKGSFKIDKYKIRHQRTKLEKVKIGGWKQVTT